MVRITSHCNRTTESGIPTARGFLRFFKRAFFSKVTTCKGQLPSPHSRVTFHLHIQQTAMRGYTRRHPQLRPAAQLAHSGLFICDATNAPAVSNTEYCINIHAVVPQRRRLELNVASVTTLRTGYVDTNFHRKLCTHDCMWLNVLQRVRTLVAHHCTLLFAFFC